MFKDYERLRDIVRRYSGYPFTPDVWFITRGPLRLLFVYDEWLSDRRQNFVLDNIGVKLTTAFTTGYYEFLIDTRTNQSIAFPSEHGRRIRGELWIVLSSSLLSLDKLRQNGVQSLRERVDIIDPYRPTGYVQNYDGYFTPDGHLLPEALQGRKEWIGAERVWIHEAYMYTAHPEVEALVYKEPYNFERVPYFPLRKKRSG